MVILMRSAVADMPMSISAVLTVLPLAEITIFTSILEVTGTAGQVKFHCRTAKHIPILHFRSRAEDFPRTM